jgi:hypothetical protein
LLVAREDVRVLAIVAFGPYVVARRGIDELGSDPYAPPCPSHAALHHVAGSELSTHPLHVDRPPLVGERGVAGDYGKQPPAGEARDQVLDDSVGKVLLLGVDAHVVEREHGNRGAPGEAGDGQRGLLLVLGRGLDPVHAQRLRDVLDLVLAEIHTAQAQPAFDVIEYRPGDGHTARVRQPLDPRCDIHALAVDSLVVDDHVPEVDPQPPEHLPRRRQLRVARGQLRLHRQSTQHRVHDAPEVGEQIVARVIDHAPAVLPDQGGHEAAVGLDRPDGSGLIECHEPAVADHVGREDRGELPFDGVNHRISRCARSVYTGQW